MGKELPKELVKEICIVPAAYAYRPTKAAYEDGANKAAQIAQSHYEPIIEAKAKEIEKLMGLLQIQFHGNKGGDYAVQGYGVEDIAEKLRSDWQSYKKQHNIKQ